MSKHERGSKAGRSFLPHRRFVMAGLSGLAALGAVRIAKASGNPSVVIIGAGVAGLSASKALTAAGVKHLVIEAADRIGGRAFTQSTSFGVPCDVGAHWLHNGESNPLVAFAKRSGIEVYEAGEVEGLFSDGEWLEGDDEEEIWDEVEDAEAAIERALDRDRDVSLRSIMDSDTSPLAAFLVGAYEHAASIGSLSTLDWDRQEEGTDMFHDGALGSLVAAWGASVPVRFNTAATHVDWSGTGVRVQTSDGTIEADAVIVTVPTSVLAKGAIRFGPNLPQKTERAIHDLPLGSYNHIVLQMSGNPFEVEEDTMLCYAGNGGTAGLLVNAGGSGLTYFDVAGDFGADLTRQGEDAMVEFARAGIADMLGAEGLSSLTKAQAFPWEHNPLAGGAYTAAKPGRARAREALKAPVADRVFFAGEATHLSKPATLDGAIAEGARAAALAADEVD
jgi:monoamine oxidase